MASREEDEEVDPLAVLVNELRHEDVQLRLTSVKKLPTIALALGAERTRTELIPFLAETVEEEDEVLWSFADQLGNFVPLVGGEEHAHCILPALESLAGVEETVVREKAVDSLRTVCEHHQEADIETYFLPLIRRLSQGDWFTARWSACGLFAPAYSRCSATIKSELRSLFKVLAQDDTPMVRRAASARLSELAKAMEAESLQQDLLPLLTQLAQDEQDSVRLLAVEAAGVVAGLLDAVSVEQLLLPVVRESVRDKSWRVRQTIADKLADLEKAVTPDVIKTEVVSAFCAMLKDPEAEVRTAACNRLKVFCENIPEDSREEIIMNEILPCVMVSANL